MFESTNKRRHVEEELHESVLRLRTVVAHMPVVLFALDRYGVFTLAEGKDLETLGLKPNAVVGLSAFEVYRDMPQILEDVRRALAGEEFSVTTDVASLRFETQYSPLLGEDRELTGVVGVATNVTERKRAEEELREANRRLNELAVLKADFTAMVAHELSSPLAAIRGLTDMLATGALRPAEQAEVLAAIGSEVDLLQALVADVQIAAAVERDDFAVQFQPVPVAPLLEEAAAYARTLPGAHPVTVSQVSPALLRADPERIAQVLRNLLSNAAKYSPDGAPIEVRARQAGGRVRIEVEDRGYGIEPADLIRIFEKFGRGRDRTGRKVPGVGLGLYLSRRIVQAHGGDLTVASTPGVGSVFAFELEVVR